MDPVRVTFVSLQKLIKRKEGKMNSTEQLFFSYLSEAFQPEAQDEQNDTYMKLVAMQNLDKMLIECDDENKIVRLTWQDCIELKIQSIEQLVKYYRTINYININYRLKLYYTLSDDNTLHLTGTIAFSLLGTCIRKICMRNVSILAYLPERFKRLPKNEKKEIHTGDLCTCNRKNSNSEEPVTDVAPHKKLVIEILNKMHTNPIESDGDPNYVLFEFQGEKFGISINPYCNQLLLRNNGWYRVEMKDIDRLSELRKAINQLTPTTFWHLTYRRDMEDKLFVVFATAELECCESASDLDKLIQFACQDFFLVRKMLYRRMNLFDRISESDMEVQSSTEEESLESEEDNSSTQEPETLEKLLIEVLKEAGVEYECEEDELFVVLDKDDQRWAHIWCGDYNVSFTEYSVYEISRWQKGALETAYNFTNRLNKWLLPKLSVRQSDDDSIHIDSCINISLRSDMLHLKDWIKMCLNDMKNVKALIENPAKQKEYRTALLSNLMNESYAYNDIDVKSIVKNAIASMDSSFQVHKADGSNLQEFQFHYQGMKLMVRQYDNDTRLELQERVWYKFSKWDTAKYRKVMEEINRHSLRIVCQSCGNSYELTTIIRFPCLKESNFADILFDQIVFCELIKRDCMKELDYFDYIHKKGIRQ